MALFGSKSSSNPTMKDSVLDKTISTSTSKDGTMTISGTIQKIALLIGMVFIAGAFTWKMVMSGNNPSAVMPWMWGGLIVGFILALVITFKPRTAPYLSPVYAAAEGVALGGISAFFEVTFATVMPGIVVTAVSITLLTTLIMAFAFQAKLIKVTEKFRSIIIWATVSIAAFYFLSIILNLIGVGVPFMNAVHGNGLLSIGISVVIVVIAAFNLLLDFDFIERGTEAGAPKYMEWYGAFGILVTLVWLYLEILKLLAKLASRD